MRGLINRYYSLERLWACSERSRLAEPVKQVYSGPNHVVLSVTVPSFPLSFPLPPLTASRLIHDQLQFTCLLSTLQDQRVFNLRQFETVCNTVRDTVAEVLGMLISL